MITHTSSGPTMADSPQPPTTSKIFDIVGVGAGPSNLALLTAVDDANEAAHHGTQPKRTALVLESKPNFSWHRGMLLDGSTMQVSYMKDLATLRNPRSKHTFVNYLKDCGRLVDFINHQTFFPTRLEFSDYLTWVAENLKQHIRYSSFVERIERIEGNGPTSAATDDTDIDDGARFVVHYRTPQGSTSVRARSVSVATGLQATLPAWAAESNRVFHNHHLLEHVAQMPSGNSGRYLVVGGGQSAAEVIKFLHSTYPTAEIDAVFNSYGFTPADDSPLANRVFDPKAVDDFFFAPPEVRAELMTRHRTTNYSCVDIDLINELYSIEYVEKVSGKRRLRFRAATEVTSLDDTHSDGVCIRLRNKLTGKETDERFDAVVCATGFTSKGVDELVAHWGGFENATVGRDYQLIIDGNPVSGLFVHGATEDTHGLGSTLLSNVAVRAGEVLATIDDVVGTPPRDIETSTHLDAIELITEAV